VGLHGCCETGSPAALFVSCVRVTAARSVDIGKTFVAAQYIYIYIYTYIYIYIYAPKDVDTL